MLRFVWGVIPWIVVGVLLLGLVQLMGQIKAKQAALEAKKKSAAKIIPPAKVIVQKLVAHRLADKINLPGIVEPLDSVVVKNEVAGQIIQVFVEEGQQVKKNQALVKIDDRDYKADLSRVRANLNRMRKDYKRYATLAERKVTAKSELDKVEAQLVDLQQQLNNAVLRLNRTVLRAPFAGVVNRLDAKQGDFLGVGTAVAHLLTAGKVKVSVGVPESDVAAVLDLERALVTIDALDSRTVIGKKIYVSSQPQTSARLYDLELELPNRDGHILPGMFARVDLVKKQFEHAVTIPLYSVITQGADKYVFVVHDGKAVRRMVRLGVLDGWQVQVKDGLKEGDQVIVVGHRLLDHGQSVEVIKMVTDPNDVFTS